MEKLNLAIGRFQPFTQGHLNMVNEGEAKCIIYQMTSADVEPTVVARTGNVKFGSKTFKQDVVKNAIAYLKGEKVSLDESAKELVKRPFTTKLVEKEFDIIKKNNPNILDVVYVKQWFDAVGHFNKFILDNKDKYEAQYLMCGDDRKDEYQDLLDKYVTPGEDISIVARSDEKYQNLISQLEVNTGKGRTDGVSGTAVRQSILDNDKTTFAKIMPKGTDALFNDFVNSFKDFADKLQGFVKESRIRMKSLKDYIMENYIM